MNIYGFTRITSGVDKNGYCHEHFVRGQEHLLHKIIRIPTKKDALSICRTSNEKIPTDSSVEAYASVLSTVTIQSTVQHRNDHGIDVRSESGVDDANQLIELLRRSNRQAENQLLLRDDASSMYGQWLLNSNRPMTSVPHEASLLQMIQSRTSISMENDLSLALSQFNVELLRQQLSLELTTTLLPLLPSRSAFRESVALSLPQPVLWNEGTRGLVDDLSLHQLLSSDPISVSSVAATNLVQNQMLFEDQLDRYKHECLANAIAIALLTHAGGGALMAANWNSFQ